MLQFLHILRYNKTIAVLSATVAQSASDLIGMGLVVLIIYVAFLSLGHLGFGPRYQKYGSIKNTAIALCSNLLGNFDYQAIRQAVGVPGQVFLIAYLCTMIYLMINLFITLLCNYMDAVKGDDSFIPEDHLVVDHFFENLRGLAVGDEEEEEGEEEQDNNEVSDQKISNILFGNSKQGHVIPKKSRKILYSSS